MKKVKGPCLKIECLIANGERVYYEKQFRELQTRYGRLEQDFNDFKLFAYNAIQIIKEQR
jgi:hypothetical protein